MATHNKSKLIDIVSEETGLTKRQVASVIKKSLDIITDKLAEGDSIGIRNFGTFEVRKYGSKVGRNFKDYGSNLKIPERFRVKFVAKGNLAASVGRLSTP
jgi:nucleoid DNA-binding protein